MRRLSLCIILMSLLIFSAMPLTAQDSQPTVPTPFIPVLPSEQQPGGPSSVPTLPVPVTVPEQALPAPEATAEPGAESAPDAAPAQDAAPEALPSLPSSDLCPVQVQQAFTTTNLICENLNSGQACIGNGIIEAAPSSPGENFQFSLPGELTTFNQLDELRLRTLGTENNLWAVVSVRAQLPTTAGGPGATTPMLIFGDVNLADATPEIAVEGGFSSARVLANFGMNVRRQPTETGVIVWQLNPGEEILATGQTPDKRWIRIEIPSFYGGVGWVYAPYLDVTGGADNLPFVTEQSPPPVINAPESTPAQTYKLLSALTNPDCTGTPNSGILLQSPSGFPDAVRLDINGVAVEVNGTIFIQAQSDANLNVLVLEGEALLSSEGGNQRINAGNRGSVPMSANLDPVGAPSISPIDAQALVGLPVELLPRPFNLDGLISSSPAGDTSAPAAPAVAEACTLSAPDADKNLRTGPGTTFDVIGFLPRGSSLEAIGQAQDSFSFVWYQTAQGWLRFDTVQINGPCNALPTVDPASISFSTVPAVPAATETPAPVASLLSSEIGEICDGSPRDLTAVSDGSNLSVRIGGTWTASAGTRISIGTEGGLFRGEFGDYIRITDAAGISLARSGEARALDFTFNEATTFQLDFSAANNDNVSARISCSF